MKSKKNMITKKKSKKGGKKKMIHKALESQIPDHIIDLIKSREEIEEMKHIINNIPGEKISRRKFEENMGENGSINKDFCKAHNLKGNFGRKLCRNAIKELVENNINFIYITESNILIIFNQFHDNIPIIIELPADYPFKPPNLFFLVPNRLLNKYLTNEQDILITKNKNKQVSPHFSKVSARYLLSDGTTGGDKFWNYEKNSTEGPNWKPQTKIIDIINFLVNFE